MFITSILLVLDQALLLMVPTGPHPLPLPLFPLRQLGATTLLELATVILPRMIRTVVHTVSPALTNPRFEILNAMDGNARQAFCFICEFYRNILSMQVDVILLDHFKTFKSVNLPGYAGPFN